MSIKFLVMNIYQNIVDTCYLVIILTRNVLMRLMFANFVFLTFPNKQQNFAGLVLRSSFQKTLNFDNCTISKGVIGTSCKKSWFVNMQTFITTNISCFTVTC